jgi:protein-S-isoprenylcysteine O-methyltransferase Ste14
MWIRTRKIYCTYYLVFSQFLEMAISTDERRFLRSWEEQREGGKWTYVGTYTFGFTIMLFLGSIALGLFMSLPFVKPIWLILISIFSVVGGFLLSIGVWQHNERKFRKIIKRETSAHLEN